MRKNPGASQCNNTACPEVTTTELQTPSADGSAEEATQMTPTVEGTDQEESNRSMCGSENGL